MNKFKILAFTHKNIDLKDIGKLHIEDTQLKERLCFLKQGSSLEEVMYLSTCNRVEFLISTSKEINIKFLEVFFHAFDSKWSTEEINWALETVSVYEGEEALNHLLKVASSIDSLVVGEREIITQVRNAYEQCRKLNLTGDLIRLIIRQTIETAKKIYTDTQISSKPVSVVSLAYRKLKELNIKLDAKFLIIGAGITNSTMAKYLKKHGFINFTVFNRTLANAEKLASEIKGSAIALSELTKYTNGFDVILTCTAASGYIITREVYTGLVKEDKSKKIIIDLAIPNDLDEEILKTYDINLIAINNLQAIATENLKEREKELEACNKIIDSGIIAFRQLHKTRKIEVAMQEVPKKVKEIREAAINGIFARDIEQLDAPSKEILDKILNYVEKKYISVPMKMARDILTEQ